MELAVAAAHFHKRRGEHDRARDALYAAVREAVDAGVPKQHVAELTGLSRPTIDRVLAS
jgi:predicted transcriptional regulator